MRARLCEGRGRTFKSCQVHQIIADFPLPIADWCWTAPDQSSRIENRLVQRTKSQPPNKIGNRQLEMLLRSGRTGKARVSETRLRRFESYLRSHFANYFFSRRQVVYERLSPGFEEKLAGRGLPGAAMQIFKMSPLNSKMPACDLPLLTPARLT
jgi:hypothetical protein